MACLAMLVVALGACADDDSEAVVVQITPLSGGEPVALSSLIDGPTVVNVWASWCAPCRQEMPALEEVHQAMGAQVAIIGITDDPDPEAAAELAAELGVTYPLYVVDSPGALRHLGVLGLPATVFLDSSAVIVGSHAGALDAAGITNEIERFHGLT